MRSFGRVKAFVFGSWAEASDDVDWLVREAASLCVVRRRTAFMARDVDDEQTLLQCALQRRWGLAAARANAQLLLDRLAYVGRGAGPAAARRAAARR
eukprot:8064201-Karenia_brevis.AAC.1